MVVDHEVVPQDAGYEGLETNADHDDQRPPVDQPEPPDPASQTWFLYGFSLHCIKFSERIFRRLLYLVFLTDTGLKIRHQLILISDILVSIGIEKSLEYNHKSNKPEEVTKSIT